MGLLGGDRLVYMAAPLAQSVEGSSHLWSRVTGLGWCRMDWRKNWRWKLAFNGGKEGATTLIFQRGVGSKICSETLGLAQVT